MQLLELTLFGFSYIILVIAFIFCVLCYRRKIEELESVLFIFSLLLLIVSVSLSQLFKASIINMFVLLCMILVSSTTFFNGLNERIHTIRKWFKRAYLGIASLLFISTIAFYGLRNLELIEGAVIAFLIASVVGSMMLLMFSRPNKRFRHLQQTDNIFAVGFAIIIPTYLILRYGFEEQYKQLEIGFLLPSAFILLGLNKIYDDLNRLSILKTNINPLEEHFKNYGLTLQEEKVATLLLSGKTYEGISEHLFISLHTVKTHKDNIYKKCQVKSRNELNRLLLS